MEYIEVKGLPDKAALEAYEKGFFIEAIQIVHAFIENQAQQLVMMLGQIHFDAKIEETWDLTDSFSFIQCLKILLIMNQISKSEYSEFIELDRIRDKIVNQVYFNNYNGDSEKISKEQFDRVFKKAINQLYFFTRKSEELLEIPKKTKNEDYF